MSSQPIQLVRKPPKTEERQKLVRRAKLLAWAGVGWHGIEAAVAVGAGLAASSIALIGFGADSLIESAAGIVLLWRFAAARAILLVARVIRACGAPRGVHHGMLRSGR